MVKRHLLSAKVGKSHHLYTDRKAEWRGYRGMGCQSDQRDGGGELESDQRDCRGLSCVIIHVVLYNSIVCVLWWPPMSYGFIVKKPRPISLERSGSRQPLCAARPQRGFRFRLARAGSATALPFAPWHAACSPPMGVRCRPGSAPLVKRPEKRSSCSRRSVKCGRVEGARWWRSGSWSRSRRPGSV
jgi:hypothetical protein